MRTELVRRIGLFLTRNIQAGLDSVEEAQAFVGQLDEILAEERAFLKSLLERGDRHLLRRIHQDGIGLAIEETAARPVSGIVAKGGSARRRSRGV
jgi:hypothetical protein